MKFKVVLFITGVIAAFAFTQNKKPGITTYYYDPPGNKTLIVPGQTNSIDVTELTTLSNWKPFNSNPFSSNGTKLAGITFNEDNQADGPDDGAATLTEAVNWLADYYTDQSPNNLPYDNSSFSRCGLTTCTEIIIRRKD
jgi:hypothetical protein